MTSIKETADQEAGKWPVDRSTPNNKPSQKAIANRRHSERLYENCSWHEWEQRRSDKFPERETGSRILVRCCLPQGGCEELRRELCEEFGGFTAMPYQGGWITSDDSLVIEAGNIYEVSVISAQDADRAISLFQKAGFRLDQEWVHITTSRETAHHTKVQ